MERIFIQTKIIGDFNRVTYSKKRMGPKRGEQRILVYFHPNPDADMQKVKAEIKRGLTFFTMKDGFLFGSQYELLKMGHFEYKEI